MAVVDENGQRLIISFGVIDLFAIGEKRTVTYYHSNFENFFTSKFSDKPTSAQWILTVM